MSDKVRRYPIRLGLPLVSFDPRPQDSQFVEVVRASDYDTLKERADALAEAVEGVLEYGPAFTAGEEAELDEALTAYREAGPK